MYFTYLTAKVVKTITIVSIRLAKLNLMGVVFSINNYYLFNK